MARFFILLTFFLPCVAYLQAQVGSIQIVVPEEDAQGETEEDSEELPPELGEDISTGDPWGSSILDTVEEEKEAIVPDRTLTTEERDALVIIEGDGGSGSGFIIKKDGLFFVVTNIHVLAPNNTFDIIRMDGESITPQGIYAAVDHDIALIKVDEQPHYLEFAESPPEIADAGDAIITPGNESGGGVVTEAYGAIRGFGPRLVEVDSSFVSGNSGSPILHSDTGKAIGVATYVVSYNTDFLREKAELSDTRWFAYRFDSVKNWQAVNWPQFREQAKAMEEIEHTTESFIRLFQKKHFNHREIESEMMRFQNIANDDSVRSEDKLRKLQTYVSRLAGIAYRDVKAFENVVTYDYFKRELESQKNYRKHIAEALENHKDRIANFRRDY